MDVMSAREFPLCALYLTVPPREVDVNVSPAKTEVHFLEPARVRAFIIKTIRDKLAEPIMSQRPATSDQRLDVWKRPEVQSLDLNSGFMRVCEPARPLSDIRYPISDLGNEQRTTSNDSRLLGRAIGQIGNKYILAESEQGLVIVDQHAAHERIVYEKLRAREIKSQALLSPIVIKLKPEQVMALENIGAELAQSGLKIGEFGEDAIAIYEAPADWNMDWEKLFKDIASEISGQGHSSRFLEKLHLKLANYACHRSVRAGQRLDINQMDALLRDIENGMRSGQCNHGRPVYKIVKISELDSMFERI
jgi:DNA mismatch repair protein MutL